MNLQYGTESKGKRIACFMLLDTSEKECKISKHSKEQLVRILQNLLESLKQNTLIDWTINVDVEFFTSTTEEGEEKLKSIIPPNPW